MPKRSGNKRKKKSDKSRWKKITSIVFATLAALMLVSYITGVFYFSNRPLAPVYFDGHKIEISNFNEIESEVNKIIENKKITVVTPDNTKGYEVPINGLDPKVTTSNYASELKEQQNNVAWPVQLFTINELNLNLNYTVDSVKLKQALTDMGVFDNSSRKSSTDASVVVKDGLAVIEKASAGTQLDEAKTFAKIESEIAKGKITIDVSDCVIPPVTDEADLADLQKSAQQIIDTKIDLTLGKTVASMPVEVKAGALVIDNAAKKVEIDETKILEYLTGLNEQIAKEQGGTTEVKVAIGDGKVTPTTTLKAAKVMDINVVSPQVYEALKTNQPLAITPELADNPNSQFTFTNDAEKIAEKSSTFVEVSISKQTLWLYKGDKLVRTAPVVTGMLGVTDTIQGLFHVLYKQEDTMLKGSTVNKDYDYNLHVNYWIPFESSGYGLHDAEGWRSYENYGGEFYKSGGSHGCVNMRNEDVGFVFANVEAGTPVWVHQ